MQNPKRSPPDSLLHFVEETTGEFNHFVEEKNHRFSSITYVDERRQRFSPLRRRREKADESFENETDFFDLSLSPPKTPLALTRSPATPTSSKTSSSPPTANSRFPEAGTASFASGISPPASRLTDSSDTPKTSSPWPSRSTTVRSSRPPVTPRSSSGTLCGSVGVVDKTVKVWNLSNCKLRSTLAGHTGPNRYWLCAAIEQGIKIWDLESKSVVEDLKVDLKAEAEKSDGSGTAATERKGTDARG
ncbi:hypothetical protein F2Q68_00017357 [Brassica cretica]|uniref:Uncharacterized protein n=1 Tax=Brassica cretica TaxID=69181 RepID=A0A8S9HHB3_BRACR|nr:hypothetical protein F2Q68_00017357 [Brassica cretica]